MGYSVKQEGPKVDPTTMDETVVNMGDGKVSYREKNTPMPNVKIKIKNHEI